MIYQLPKRAKEIPYRVSFVRRAGDEGFPPPVVADVVKVGERVPPRKNADVWWVLGASVIILFLSWWLG